MAAEEQVNGVPTSALSAGRRRRVDKTLVVAAVWAAALTGGVLGVAALIGKDASSPSPHPRAQRAHALGMGDRVLTSFGSFSMNSVQTLVGPQHAMHMRVPRGLQPIQVMIAVNNLQRRPLRFDSRWFRLVDARGTFPVGYGTRRELSALTTKGVLLRFAVPPGTRLPRLEYRDPAGRAPVLVTLPSTEVLQTFNPATHQHGG